MLASILLLCACATLGWALFMFILKPQLSFSFVHTPLRTLAYFLALTLLIALMWLPYAGLLYEGITFTSIVFLAAILLGFNPWLYRFAHAEHRVRVPVTPAHPDLELLHIDGRFLISKLGDVVFQQTVAGTLILMLAPWCGLPLPALSLLFALLFFLGHLGLVVRLPHRWSMYFLASALAGGAFIPYLMLTVPGGFYYAVALHMLWYVVTGAFYWTGESRRAKRRG